MTTLYKRRNLIARTGVRIGAAIKKNFLFATVNFVFIFVFIQAFQFVFGGENSIVAIILTILMGIYAGRDVSASPLRQFVTHTFVLAALCVAACFSVSLGPWIAIPINFVIAFCVLYAYTYDYANHLYFPYILSYLFLVYISPVAPDRLPFRLLSVAAGTFVMLIYALFLRPRNIVKPARNAVMRLLAIAASQAFLILEKRVTVDVGDEARALVRELSGNADARRKGAHRLSAQTTALIEVGRGAENLIVLFADKRCADEKYVAALTAAAAALGDIQAYAERKSEDLPVIDETAFRTDGFTEYLYLSLVYLKDNLSAAHAKGGQKLHGRASVKSFLRSLVAYSPMKLAYALRTALLLTALMVPVQFFALAHGKWLIFTLASVSLPYADDVRKKGQKRLLATLIGGAIATVAFSLIPDASARTAIMMLSGYLSFYFAGYTGNYACATVGALGGAVAGGITGWAGVATVFAIRLGYIAAGVAIAYVANLALFPYRRRRASQALFRRYTDSVRRLCSPACFPDAQTYYDLVIKNNLLEAKLLRNSEAAGKRDEMNAVVIACRKQIKMAHYRAYDAVSA